MKRHVKLYFEFFNFDASDFIPCELCDSKAVDIHHIDARGMGGSKTKDTIQNLMALCRRCHVMYGDKKQFIELLEETHMNYIHKRAKLN